MLVCTKCNRKYSERKPRYLCDCGGVLLVENKLGKPELEGIGLRRYKDLLPVKRELVTLREGNTPLIKARNLEKRFKLRNLFLKYEGVSPTGSFKDRGSCVTITKALEFGFKRTAVASTGNMGASVAAYSAKAGLECNVFVPEDTPEAKLAQIIAYGAKLHKVHGHFKQCVEQAQAMRKTYLAMTGLNPYYIEGEKTIGYELAEAKPQADIVILPMGTGGVLTATWKGFKEYHQLDLLHKLPKMIGIQPHGCSPIVDAWEHGHEEPEYIEHAGTVADAVLVKVPFNGHTASRAVNESNGFMEKVTDKQIIDAIKLLGSEGVFAEPAGALPLAGLVNLLKDGKIDRNRTIMLVITGHGLKDPDVLIEHLVRKRR